VSDLKSELLAVRERHGKLTAGVVLADASDPEHPLHDRFEWDDGVAAERFRLEQARTLIRSVRIVYRRPSGEIGKVREFHSVSRPELPETSYTPLAEVVQDPLQTAIIRRAMRRDIQALRLRYEMFEELRVLIMEEFGISETG
jgi:hypothetical protein